MNVRIMIADDHKLVRAGLSMLIEEVPGYEVVALAGDGVEALEMARSVQPDLLLMDIQMPRMSGLECLARLRVELPAIRVLILSMHATAEHVRRAMELGALGYLLKDSTPTELELAFKTVMLDNIWLSAMISSHVLGVRAGADVTPQGGGPLTPRQLDVLKRLAQGSAVKSIAHDLGLSVKTVDTYRAQILERLGLRDLPALVRYAVRTGLVEP
ncbi:MAG: hypothetical protein RIQ60_2132 [Pseudomonadota bacterium]|jgi:DNA-binding NarL/FixJ family response regulator